MRRSFYQLIGFALIFGWLADIWERLEERWYVACRLLSLSIALAFCGLCIWAACYYGAVFFQNH
jgi:MFS family permease